MNRNKFKRSVVSTERKSGSWKLLLSCSHEALRPVKKRLDHAAFRSLGPLSIEDQPPSWVYCKVCEV